MNQLIICCDFTTGLQTLVFVIKPFISAFNATPTRFSSTQKRIRKTPSIMLITLTIITMMIAVVHSITDVSKHKGRWFQQYRHSDHWLTTQGLMAYLYTTTSTPQEALGGRFKVKGFRGEWCIKPIVIPAGNPGEYHPVPDDVVGELELCPPPTRLSYELEEAMG